MHLRYSLYFILRFFSRLFFGRNFLIRHKKINNLYCFIKSIFDLFSYVHWKQKNWERNNPEAPWLVQDSIAYLDDGNLLRSGPKSSGAQPGPASYNRGGTEPTTTDTDAKCDLFVFRYNGAVWQEVGRTLNLSES